MFDDLFEILRSGYFYLSAILLLAGVYLGPAAVDREITPLLRYPRWMLRLMDRYARRDHRFVMLFAAIFFLNNVSLFSGFICGFFIILPALAAFFTGFHVAVATYEMMRWQGIWYILINPVAWLEFPAAWISYTLGMKLAEAQLHQFDFAANWELFEALLPLYLKYVAVLLFFAAVLESVMIVYMQRFQDGE